MTEKVKNRLELELHAQRTRIEDHGGDLGGYLERYGEPGGMVCYGNGGEAIYRADLAALKSLEHQLARHNFPAR